MQQNSGNLIAAVDIGTTKVCTVIAEVHEDEINVIGVGWQENTGVSKGSINNIAETTEAIRKSVQKAEDMAKSKIDMVIASISGKHIMGMRGHGEIALSNQKQKEITEDDKRRAMEGATSVRMSQERETLHVVPTQYVVDAQDEIDDPLGMTGMKLEVDAYMITGSLTAIDNVKKVVERAGYGCENIILQGLASAHSVLYPDEKEVGVLLIDIGGGTTDLSLYYRKSLRFVRVIPVGGQLITNDIVQGLQTPKAVAELLKKKYGLLETDAPIPVDSMGLPLAVPDEYIEVPDMGSSKVEKVERKILAKFIKPRVQELIMFVEEELKKEGIDRAMYAGGIVLTGGTSLLKGIDVLFKEEMKLRVRVGAPLKEKIVGLYDIVSSPEWATVMGLIEYYVREHSREASFSSGGGGNKVSGSVWAWIKKNILDKI
jgi:cell division protein FtsA